MYLVVPRICIHEAELFMPSSGINELVNPWQWERILQACLVEVCIIDIDSLFFIWFLHHDYISQPFRVVSFPDELGFEELVVLLTDRHVPLRVKPATFLNDRFVSGIDIEPMDDD